jgi:hypothetical protein
VDWPADRRGDRRRGDAFLRHQPPQGPHRGPGYKKMAVIAKAMGFSPEAWFEEAAGGAWAGPSDDGCGIAGWVEHLFDAVRNPSTGEPHTNAEVARMTLGTFSEEDAKGIRAGTIADPTVGQVAALAAVFGVEPSYLLDRGKAPFDGELMEVLQDEAIREAVREISRLPERERRLVLGIVRQFGNQQPSG